MDDVVGVEAEVRKDLGSPTGPGDSSVVDRGMGTKAKGEDGLTLGEVAFRGHDLLGDDARAGADSDPGADAVAIRGGSDEAEADPMVAEGLVVAEEDGRAIDLREDDIEVAIAIDVSVGGPAPGDGAEEIRANLGFGGGEELVLAAAALIPEKLGGLAVVLMGLVFLNIGIEMSVGGKDIEPSVEIAIEEKEAKLEQVAACGADAGGGGFVSEMEWITLGDIKPVHFIGEVSDRDGKGVVVPESGGIDAHRTASGAEGIEGDARAGADFLEGSVAVVAEDEVLDGVVGDNEVDPAVAVQVDRGDPEGLGKRFSRPVGDLDAGTGGDVGESSAAVVVVEGGMASGEVSRGAVGAGASVIAEGNLEIRSAIPGDVMADEEVEQAVVVDVDPGGARAPVGARRLEARGSGDVGKSAATQVLEEALAADAGDEEIRPAVVVVVAAGHAHPVKVRVEAAACGDIRKLAGTVVSVEGERVPGGGIGAWR